LISYNIPHRVQYAIALNILTQICLEILVGTTIPAREDVSFFIWEKNEGDKLEKDGKLGSTPDLKFYLKEDNVRGCLETK